MVKKINNKHKSKLEKKIRMMFVLTQTVHIIYKGVGLDEEGGGGIE